MIKMMQENRLNFCYKSDRLLAHIIHEFMQALVKKRIEQYLRYIGSRSLSLKDFKHFSGSRAPFLDSPDPMLVSVKL
jgi:hypothetical protein